MSVYETVSFEVTPDHIRVGVAGDCALCPIAQGLRDAGYKDARVGLACLILGGRAYALPLELQQRAADFDEGRGMQPFKASFPLIPIEPARAVPPEPLPMEVEEQFQPDVDEVPV